MKSSHFIKAAVFGLFTLLASCAMEPAFDSSSQWRTTENGVSLWSGRGVNDTNHHWSGPVDKENKAHGFGKFTQYSPDIPGDPIFGGGFYESTVTREGKMVHGKLEGEVISKFSVTGKVQRDQWANGEWVSGEVIRVGKFPDSDSGGLSDGQMVGAVLGLGGIAAGDADLAGAGLTALSGDESGGLRKMQDWANANPGSGGTGINSGTGAAKPGKGNLIDEWQLRGTVKKAGDHMKYYIQAADQAYATYQKSGEEAYYGQHREYATLAKDFHERTGTGTQGYSR